MSKQLNIKVGDRCNAWEVQRLPEKIDGRKEKYCWCKCVFCGREKYIRGTDFNSLASNCRCQTKRASRKKGPMPIKTVSFAQWCKDNGKENILDRWDYELNKYNPDSISFKSNYRMYFKCPRRKHNSYPVVLGSISGNDNRCECHGCYLEENSFGKWCEENAPELLDLWDYGLNTKTPYQVAQSTKTKYYFKCPNMIHSSSLHDLAHITSRDHKISCSECNSFGFWCEQNNPDILALWDYDKNKVSPYEVSRGTHSKYYFKCPKGKHDSQQKSLSNVCRDHKILCETCNSFGQFIVDNYGESYLNQIWDYNKNVQSPFEISYGSSNKKVYLNCLDKPDHESYLIAPANFIQGKGCPSCRLENGTSKLANKVTKYIQDKYNYTLLQEHNCTLKCINPKTKRPLPYDNQIIIDDSTSLIIEVMGIQHFYASGFARKASQKHNTTPEEELQDLQWRDKYKKQYAISQGYYYLAIPYTAEKDDSYKSIIDEQIQFILHNSKLLNIPNEEAI